MFKETNCHVLQYDDNQTALKIWTKLYTSHNNLAFLNMAFLEFENKTKQIKTEKSIITYLRGNYSGFLQQLRMFSDPSILIYTLQTKTPHQ